MGRARGSGSHPAASVSARFAAVIPEQSPRRPGRAWLPANEKHEGPDAAAALNKLWSQNGFAVIGSVQKLLSESLKRRGAPELADSVVRAYVDEAMESDNANLISVSKDFIRRYIGIDCDALAENGVAQDDTFESLYGHNAMEIIAAVSGLLRMRARSAGLSGEEAAKTVSRYAKEAMNEDYEGLIELSRRYLWEHCGIQTAPRDRDWPRCRKCNDRLKDRQLLYCDNC